VAQNRKSIEKVLLVGAALGAVYVATRPKAERREGTSKLVDWPRVEETAIGMVRGMAGGEIANRQEANRRYRAMVAESTTVIARYTGMHLDQPLASVYVFDRQDWIRANLEGFRRLFGRIEEIQSHMRSSTSLAGVLLGEANRAVLSVQLGVLVGYLARRVLGQYDLALLGKEAVTTGSLYFVEPNIAAMVERFELPPEEFRAWIALHEVTHAFEFEAHPWVRDYMNDLLTTYLGSLSEDLFYNRPGGALTLLAGRIKDNLFERGHMLEMMMSPQQRDVFRKLQALMALMEGYSNHVMNQVGARHLKDHDTLKQTFESRAKSRGVAEQLFIKLTGLDIKLEQYVLGERFCEQVASQRGLPFLNQIWQGPDHLPTLDEIHDADKWVARHQRIAA